jgi:signal transduction histidine kinase
MGRRPLVFDIALAGVLAVLLGVSSAGLAAQSPWPVAGRVAMVAAIGLAHAAVALRRVAPVLGYAVGCAVMLVIVAAPDLTDGTGAAPPILLPSSMVFPVLLYAVAAYARRPWPLVGLGVGLAGAAATTVRLWTFDWSENGPTPTLKLFVPAALLAIVLAAWGLGRFRAARTAYREAEIATLEERALRAEERRAERAEQAAAAERARIAWEMHDVVAHSLAVIVRQADGGRFAAAKDPRKAAEVLGVIATTGRQALTDMRAVLGVLRSSSAEPTPTIEDLPALISRVSAAGTPVTLTTTGEPGPLDTAASLAAYRVVQEALTNVVRHATAGAAARVHLNWTGDGLDVAITDDGAAPPDGTPEGNGLIGMRERVAAVGGRLTAGPADGGFAVRAFVPGTPA